MRHLLFSGLVLMVLGLATLASASQAAAQAQQTVAQVQKPVAQELSIPEVPQEKLAKYATAFVEIGNVRDQYHAQFARTANKTGELQAELRKKLKEEVHKILETQGLTADEYEQITWVVSVDPKQMETFHQLIGKQKGGAPK